MKKILITFIIWLISLVWLALAADTDILSFTPASQYGISWSLVSFNFTVKNNSTWDRYIRLSLPSEVDFVNSSTLPFNTPALSLWIEHNPYRILSAWSQITIDFTWQIVWRKLLGFSYTDIQAQIHITTWYNQVFILTSAVVNILPIGDLQIIKKVVWPYPNKSWDVINYLIIVQNIWSNIITWINVVDVFPTNFLIFPWYWLVDGVTQVPTLYNSKADNYKFTLKNLQPGNYSEINIQWTLKQDFSANTKFCNEAFILINNNQFSTTNDNSSDCWTIPWAPDLRIKKTLISANPAVSWDLVWFLITYWNSWTQTASEVFIEDIFPPQLTPTAGTIFPMWDINPWAGWSFIFTWRLNQNYPIGTIFSNSVKTFVSSWIMETNMTNNTSSATWIVKEISKLFINIKANNLTRSNMDLPNPDTQIWAVAWDVVQLTITYWNNWNASSLNTIISLLWLNWFISIWTFNPSIGTLLPNQNGTIIITWIIWPQNFISFTPIATISNSTNISATDDVNILEPLTCGDWLITRTEKCDTNWQIWVMLSWQVCENQQWMCVIVTKSIVNLACLNYSYINPQTNTIWTWTICSSVPILIDNSSCSSLTSSTPIKTSNGYSVNFACQANNGNNSTPIRIDCWNWNSVYWFGTSLHGTCNYSAWFIGNAQCMVANDTNNPSCRQSVSLNAGQCKSLEALDWNIIIVDEDDGEWQADFLCETNNWVLANKIQIDCWNGDKYSDLGVSSLRATCKYNVNNPPKNFTVKCDVDGSSNNQCEQDIIVDLWTFWRCGDGIRQWYEKCDEWENNGQPGYNCTENCDIPSYSTVACFNVGNTNLSLQPWEYLPFWRTIENSDELVSTCNSSNVNKVRKSSLRCDFKFYNWIDKESDWTTWKTILDKDCNSDNRNWKTIFNYLLNDIWKDRWSLQHAFGKYYFQIPTVSTYGEYKIVLDEIRYDYCDWDDRQTWVPVKRLCDVDFVLTKPYLAQKSSFGVTPKATNIKLQGFKDIKWNDLINKTDLASIMVLDESDYNGWTKIKSLMTTFISKYEKLAIKYSTLPDWTIVSKVPWQQIFVFKGNWQTVTRDESANWYSKPFTAIFDNVNLIVKWSILKTNWMFLVHNGVIKFQEPDTNKCYFTQTVQWIFITDIWFGSPVNLSNDTLTTPRCEYGWLHIKWVLIWNGLDDLVKSRRSQLNHRFMTSSSSESAIKAERRNEIFNWASVLIEYSPSLWNALPPGADEFTKQLSVYKK